MRHSRPIFTVVVVTNWSPKMAEFSAMDALFIVSTCSGVRLANSVSDFVGNISLRMVSGGKPSAMGTKM